MNMWMRHIHPVSFDSAGYPANEHNGAVMPHLFHDTYMGQGIVDQAIPIEVPGIVEEHQVAGLYDRPAVESAVFPDVVVNEAHAIGSAVGGGS